MLKSSIKSTKTYWLQRASFPSRWTAPKITVQQWNHTKTRVNLLLWLKLRFSADTSIPSSSFYQFYLVLNSHSIVLYFFMLQNNQAGNLFLVHPFFYKNQQNLRTKAFFSAIRTKIRTKKGFYFSLGTKKRLF